MDGQAQVEQPTSLNVVEQPTSPDVVEQPTSPGATDSTSTRQRSSSSGERSGSTSDELSLEVLQQQLKEMEDEQAALAEKLQKNADHGLDSRFAFIEEQFRKNFDERFSAPTTITPTSAASATSSVVRRRLAGPLYQSKDDSAPRVSVGDDMLRSSSVFRELSRALGLEWRPLFLHLMSEFPAEQVEKDVAAIEQHASLIQAYKCLVTWRDAKGADFELRTVVDALRHCGMEDIADATLELINNYGAGVDKEKTTKLQRRRSDVGYKTKKGYLENQNLLQLAKKLGGDWEPLGKVLSIPEEELVEIREAEGNTYQGAFKMLWSWKQAHPGSNDVSGAIVLKDALTKVDKTQLADTIVIE